MRDWVPLVGYGDSTTVPAASQLIIPLWDIPLLGTDGEGEVDEQGRSLTLRRIIGTWQYAQNASENTDQPMSIWRIMTLMADYETGTLLTPWLTYSMYRDNEAANLRFLEERIWDAGAQHAFGEGFDAYSIPAWHNIDFRTAEPFGLRAGGTGLWPAWVVENNSLESPLVVQHRWRAVVTGRDV